MLLSPTRHFWPHPSVCSHPPEMLWEPLPREWGADPGEDPSCYFTSASPRQAQLARWTPLVGLSPPASLCGQTGLPGTGNCCHHSSLLLLPKPLPILVFQPCHHFSAVVFPTPSSSQRPGGARTKHDSLAYSSAHGRSLLITVPSCPSLSLCPHLSPALLLTNQLFIALCVLHLGELAARPCFPSLIHTAPAPQEPLPGSVRG